MFFVFLVFYVFVSRFMFFCFFLFVVLFFLFVCFVSSFFLCFCFPPIRFVAVLAVIVWTKLLQQDVVYVFLFFLFFE